jgi:hypothetical protein
VINISTDASRESPRWPQAEDQQPRPPTAARPAGRAGWRSVGVRIGDALVIVGPVLFDGLASVVRRWGDRWFMINDEEACWRGWQTTKLYGGLGRRYRDLRFDTLAELAMASGRGPTYGPAAGYGGQLTGASWPFPPP